MESPTVEKIKLLSWPNFERVLELMESEELIVLVILAVFILYGLGTLIAAPLLIRKFYRLAGFDKVSLPPASGVDKSLLLDPLVTGQLYSGNHGGYILLHAKYQLRKTSWLTFSKAKRKQLQARWSVTQLSAKRKLTEFALLPKTDPATVLMMLSVSGEDLSADDKLDQRYLLITDHPEQVLPLLTNEIRDFLLDRELASIEITGSLIVIKRAWPGERIGDSIQAEFDTAVTLANTLQIQVSPESSAN